MIEVQPQNSKTNFPGNKMHTKNKAFWGMGSTLATFAKRKQVKLTSQMGKQKQACTSAGQYKALLKASGLAEALA